MASTRKSTRAKKAPSGCQSIEKFFIPSKRKSEPDSKPVTTKMTLPVPPKVPPKVAPSNKRKPASAKNNPASKKSKVNDVVVKEEKFKVEDDGGESDPEVQIRSLFRDRENPTGVKVDHKCSVCYDVFSSKKLLDMHINLEHKENPLYCDHCKLGFGTHTELKSHLSKARTCKVCKTAIKFCLEEDFENHLKAHSDTSFSCALCPVKFDNKKILRDHEKSHLSATVTKVFSCLICQKLFKSVMSAMACARMHTQGHKCHICDMACRTPAELRRHLETHDSTKKYQCVMCSSILKSEASLKLHIKEMHERPKEKIETCQYDGCTKKFFTKKQRIQHENSSHGEKTFKCYQCEQKFTSYPNLLKHFSTKHDDKTSDDVTKPEVEKIECSVCKKVLASKYYLKVHMSQHNKVKNFSCTICEKRFCRKWVLQTHMKTIHMGEESRTHVCTLCPSAFINLSQLNYHVKSFHTNINEESGEPITYPCPERGCDHVSKTKAQLTAHLKSLKHCKGRAYQCPNCPLSFNRKWTMEEHVLRRHEDVRRVFNYKCMLCGRGFYFHKSFVIHSHLNHSQKCEYCELQFVTTRYHMDHRRIVHNIDDKLEKETKFEPCKICGKYIGGHKLLKKHIIKEHCDVPFAYDEDDDPNIGFVGNKPQRRALKRKAPKKAKKTKSST